MSQTVEGPSRGFPLSPQQRRVWRLAEAHPECRSEVRLRVGPKLDADRLRRAVDVVVARNAVLRTSFRQVPSLDYPLQFPGEAVLPISQSEPQTPAHSGAFEARWIRAEGADRRLILSLPTLCADARTLEEIVRRVAAEYDGRRIEADELPYVQFAEWQNGLLADDADAEALAFWSDFDASALRNVRLPFPHTPSSSQATMYSSESWTLGREDIDSLQALAARTGVSTASVFLTAWCALLMRIVGETDLVVGDVVDGREPQLTASALGLYAREIPLRVSMRPDSSFVDSLQRLDRVRATAREMSDYFSFDKHKPAPVLSFGFQYDELERKHTVADGELVIETCEAPIGRSHLTLRVSRGEDGVDVDLLFDPAHISSGIADRMLRYFQNIARAALRERNAPLRSLDLIPQAERHWLVEGVNATDTGRPRQQCFHDWFRETAAANPEAPAVVYRDAALSFAQLEARSNRLAHHLLRLGVRAETRVGVLLDRSLDSLVAVLGIWKAGGVYVPLDPMRADRALAFTLEDAGVRLVLVQEGLRAILPQNAPPAFALDTEAAALLAYPESAPPSTVGSTNLAYVIYTSGSTGKPKGVMVSHGSLVNLTHALDRAIYSGSGIRSVSINAPLTFDASIKQIAALALGIRVEVIPEAVRSDGQQLLDYLEGHEIEVLDCTPFQFRLLLQAGWSRPDAARPRFVLMGGEPIDTELLHTLQSDSRTTFFNLYGPTECTVDVAVACVTPAQADAVVGRPLANVRAYVLDAAMNPVPQGVSGELFVGGHGVARGYLERPGLTASHFVADPFRADGSRLYRTGDVASWEPDGVLRVHGRVDRQVKIRGYRIEPGEIESVLRSQPGVGDAAVVVHDAPDGARVLVGYVVTASKSSATLADLRNELRQLLPEYMVPAKLILLDALPFTSSGKLDRRALPDPATAVAEAAAVYIAPRSSLETDIAEIWKSELRLPRIGMKDNFFDLGGHSLLMARVHARLRARFNREIPMIELFRHPTVELLAGYFSGHALSTDASFDRALERAARRRKRRDRDGETAHG